MAAEEASPPATLYVGDLHSDATDADLINLFSSVGSLSSVHVCRDSVTKHSLGYAYVNFIGPADGTPSRAIEQLNHKTVNGQPIRIMWSIRDPDARISGVGNLFVKNLDESLDNAKLYDVFSRFGKILSCKVALSHNGKSKGYGFVQFESEESAEAAIANLNGNFVRGKQMYVNHFIKKSEREPPNSDTAFTNLYIKNVDLDLTEEHLQEVFSKFGKISSIAIAKDSNGRSRGFGFVSFDNPDDAKQAVETMNGMQLGSKYVYVARAQKKAERRQILRRQFEERRNQQVLQNRLTPAIQGANVYVKNINEDIDDNDLREQFSQFGTIASVKIMRNDKGISKGFGFVCFSSPEEASAAVSGLRRYMLHGKPLYVAIAQRKEERLAFLRMQHAQPMSPLQGPPPAPAIPGGFHHPMYYVPPPNVVPHIPPRQGVMYQPFGIRPEWRGNGYPPHIRPNFQHMPFSMIAQTNIEGTIHFIIEERMKRQKSEMKYMHGRHPDEMRNEPVVPPIASNQQGTEMLSSMLAAAAPQQQKQILGERLFPVVEKLEPDLARKITGMLLEMDNSELLLLLESPESLTAKVDEAVKVLEISKATAGSNQDPIQSYLSAEVAVN
ncbi:hypothetical protein ACLOJK_020942 [Asimina triloba]